MSVCQPGAIKCENDKPEQRERDCLKNLGVGWKKM